MCGCSCHAPSRWLLWALGLGQQPGPRPARLLEPPPLPAGSPSPRPAPDRHPLHRLKLSSKLQHSSFRPSAILRSPPSKSLPGLRFGGDASPSRAPRCACTLAVTCEAGEQRFRCVRGVPAQLSGYTKQAAHRLLVLYPATTTNPSLLLYKEQPAAFIARPWFLQPWPEL